MGATPGGSVTSSLKGTGAAAVLALSPASHSYGSVTIGASSVSQTYTVTNTGQAASGPVLVTITGADASDFTEDSTTCGGSVPAGSSCTVSVTFAPAAAGTRTAKLTAAATPGGSVSAALSGTGAAKALLAITPPSFDYGQVAPGSTAAVESYTVTNNGLAASGKVTVALGGTGAAGFVLDSTTCGAKLTVGASCTVRAHFAPVAPGAATATLSATASPGGTATASLQGTGSTVDVSPASHDFGDQNIGTVSARSAFTLTNYGMVPLTLSGFGESDGHDFHAPVNTCAGTELQPGGSCSISVVFVGAALGTHSSTLTATFTGPGGASYPASFTVSGTTVLPPPDLATSVGVASQDLSNAAITISVTNLGGTDSVPATMTIDTAPTVLPFVYTADAGTDCAAQPVPGGITQFTCPVPVIPAGVTYTRTLTIQNLFTPGPYYMQVTATTIMPGDTNAANNTGSALVTFSS